MYRGEEGLLLPLFADKKSERRVLELEKILNRTPFHQEGNLCGIYNWGDTTEKSKLEDMFLSSES